jgi:hypothetical protein
MYLAVDQSTVKACTSFSGLLSALQQDGALNVDDLKEGVYRFLNGLDDIIVDVPKAVRTVGQVLQYFCFFSFFFFS